MRADQVCWGDEVLARVAILHYRAGRETLFAPRVALPRDNVFFVVIVLLFVACLSSILVY